MSEEKPKVSEEKPKVSEEELAEMLRFVEENAAWIETINQALSVAAKARNDITTKSKEYWDKIILKHGLDTKKVFRVDQKTGEITEVISQNPVERKGEEN